MSDQSDDGKAVYKPMPILRGCMIPMNAEDLLHSFPEWHKAYFDEWVILEIPEDGYHLWKYVLDALKNLDEKMSITDLCLLLFPLPQLGAYRGELAMNILAASHYNNLKLSEEIHDYMMSTGWNSLKNIYVELDELESASQRRVLGESNFFIHIWRRHLEESKAGKIFGEEFMDDMHFSPYIEKMRASYPKLKGNKTNQKKTILNEIRYQKMNPLHINKALIKEYWLDKYRINGATSAMFTQAWKELSKDGVVKSDNQTRLVKK